MKIKLYNIVNFKEFMHIIETSHGSVYLISSEGDRLNLKSKLVQFFSFAELFTSARIESLELEVSDADTAKKFMEFMMRSNIAPKYEKDNAPVWPEKKRN